MGLAGVVQASFLYDDIEWLICSSCLDVERVFVHALAHCFLCLVEFYLALCTSFWYRFECLFTKRD